MVSWKTSEVAKEEARLAELRKLYDDGKITTAEYVDAMNKLKQTGEGTSASSAPNVLSLVQLGLLVGLIGAVVYAVKVFKS